MEFFALAGVVLALFGPTDPAHRAHLGRSVREVKEVVGELDESVKDVTRPDETRSAAPK